jgi:hypothetical protein
MSPTFLLQQFAPGMILAALVAFIAGISARWLRASWIKQVAFGLAVGAGYATGHWKSGGWPKFPPADATHWLIYSALGSVVLGVGYGVGRGRWGIGGRVVSFGVLLIGTLALILMPKFKNEWTFGQGAAWVTALTLAAALMGWSLDTTIRVQRTRLALLWLLVAAAGASLALALSGSMLLGQLAAVLAAVVCGVIGASVAGACAERAIVPGVATLFVGLITCGYFYAELPWSSTLLLAISPGLAMIVRGVGTVRTDLLRAVIVAVTVGAAVMLALRASPPIDYY